VQLDRQRPAGVLRPHSSRYFGTLIESLPSRAITQIRR
jgi:hypothetical protein